MCYSSPILQGLIAKKLFVEAASALHDGLTAVPNQPDLLRLAKAVQRSADFAKQLDKFKAQAEAAAILKLKTHGVESLTTQEVFVIFKKVWCTKRVTASGTCECEVGCE